MSREGRSVVGFTLPRARAVLHDAGQQVAQVQCTGPPASLGRQPDGEERVVQQRQVAAGQVSLVVAREMRLEEGADDSNAKAARSPECDELRQARAPGPRSG